MKEIIKDIKVKKVEDKVNIDFYRVSYVENGKKKEVEVAKSLDVVKILLYHKEKNAFLIIRQFRPLVYINHPDLAYRYELCGGREDKPNLTSKEVAKEEVLEECGYKVDDLEYVTTFVTYVKMHLYYACIDESMKVNSGGGVDYENIQLHFLPVDEAKEFALNPKYPNRPAFAFSIWWWFDKKYKNIQA